MASKLWQINPEILATSKDSCQTCLGSKKQAHKLQTSAPPEAEN